MSTHRLAFVRTFVVAVLWSAAPVSHAAAQGPGVAASGHPSTAAAQPSSAGRWEIEAYGGASIGRALAGGSRAVPPPGPPILTSSPALSSRQVSSWLFGDGAGLLNSVNDQFGISTHVTPLDAAFVPLSSTTGASWGIRVRRSLRPRVSAEFGMDMLGRSSARGLDAAAAEAASSFKIAFADLLATGPLSGVFVEATPTSKAATGSDLVVSGALHLRLSSMGAFVPYVTAGAGVMTGAGRLPSATIEAHYQFSILGGVPIDERDAVTLRYARGATLVGVFGGGLCRDFSDRWGLSIDGRVFVGRNDTRLLLDASPSVARGTPADFIETGTSPEIQFSNDPAIGRQSTLSGAALNGFTVFSGGLQTRVLVSVGVFRRF